MAKSEAQKKAEMKYKKKAWKRVPLDVRIEEYEAFKEYAERTGQTVGGLLRKTMQEMVKNS